MKVYIVVDTPSYEQSTILAVCSTKKIAEEYVANSNRGYKVYNDIEIEEWTLDES